jgi:predicted RNase H-like HicB family nuclease
MVELEREVDGRWIADIADLPGIIVYGPTREAALSGAQALALRVLADRLEHGESLAESLEVSFFAPTSDGGLASPGTEAFPFYGGLAGPRKEVFSPHDDSVG